MLDFNFNRRDFLRIGSIGAGMSTMGLSDVAFAADEELALKFENISTPEDALQTLLKDNNNALKTEVLQHLNLKENDLVSELNEIKERKERII